MNYTEMLFNRDERLVNLLNQADSKNLELIEEINNREEEIERLNNIINELEKFVDNYIIWGGGKNEGKVFKWTGDGYVEVYDFITDLSKKIQELKGSDKND